MAPAAVAAVVVVLLAEAVVARLPHQAPLAVVVQLLDLVLKSRLPYPALLPVARLLREAQLLRLAHPVPLRQEAGVAALLVLVQGLVASESLGRR